MIRDELYINKIKVDVGKTDISLNYQSNLLNDISKIVSNNSYTIKLPKTAKNLALIECSHIPSSTSRYPYLKHKGSVLRNGIEIIKDANVVLLKTGESIEIALSWGNVTNFASIVNDDKKLTDIPHGTVEGIDWVVWNNKGSNSTQFPLIDYGFNSGDPNVWYHPVITVRWILDKIQEESGVTFSFPADKLSFIDKMIVPLLTRNDSQELYDKYPISFIGDGVSRTRELSGEIGLNIKFNGDSTQSKYGDISEFTYTTDSIHSLTTIGYMLHHDSENTRIKGTIMSSFTIVTSQSYDNRARLEIRVNTSLLHTISPTSFQQTGDKQYTVGFNIDSEVSVNQGDVLFFVLNTHVTTTTVVQNSNLSISISKRGEILFGEKYPFVPNLPDIKQIDFIKAIASMVGLFALPDGANGIKFIPFDNLRKNMPKAVDWTDRVIMAYKTVTPRSLEYTLNNIAQNNRFRYKEDDSVNGNYDGDIQVNDATIDYERDAITLPFSACDTKGGVAYIPLYSYNDNGELEYNKANSRILLLDGTKGIFKGLEWTTLIANNYQTYKGLINNAKVVTEYIRLNSIELRDLEMDIPVYLAQYGCYLAIIEIKTKENDICECKLLKVW